MKKTPNQLSRVAIAYHPGDTLKEKLNELGMSIKEFSVRTSKPEKTIIAVIKGTSSITSEMAVSFESVTRIPAHFWMNKQRLYDEYQIRMKREQTILQSVSWMRRFPVKEMANRGWIAACSSVEEKVDELFHFFGISTEKAWEDYYLNQELKIAFRISLAHAKEPEAISAWLRKGELQAAEIELEAVYSDKLLRSNLMLMKQLMVDQPEDFYQKLQSLCSKSGIILINTKCLPKAPINGATRWINDRPIIQLSNRYNRYDMFWFNFFHELGHILLHGKKDIFLEEAGCMEVVRDKEAEADLFASNILLTKEQEAEIIAAHNYTLDGIKASAAKYSTHPSIIVGRLQHLKEVKYWQDKELLPKIDI